MTKTIFIEEELNAAVCAYGDAWCRACPSPDPGHMFSERYLARKESILALAKTRQNRRRVLHSVASVFIVLVLSLGIIAAASPTARAAVSNWLAETYNKLVKYAFTHNEDDHAYLICAPESLPEGFECVETKKEDEYTIKVYKNAETGEYLRFEYSKATEAMKAEVEKQKAGAELLVRAGAIEKYCLDSGAARRVFWYDPQRELVFFADSSLSREALAASLKTISIRLPLYEPASLPEGYEEAERKDAYPWVSIIWQNSAEKQLKLDYQDMSEADGVYVWSGGDEVVSEPVDIGGITGTYYPSSLHEPGSGVVWIDESQNIIFIINADALEKDDLIAFARSITCTETEW